MLPGVVSEGSQLVRGLRGRAGGRIARQRRLERLDGDGPVFGLGREPDTEQRLGVGRRRTALLGVVPEPAESPEGEHDEEADGADDERAAGGRDHRTRSPFRYWRPHEPQRCQPREARRTICPQWGQR